MRRERLSLTSPTSPSPFFLLTSPPSPALSPLQFQLTVNCSALIICFIGAVVGGQEPLNVLQLL